MTKHVDLTELNNVADGDKDFMKETISLLVNEIPADLNNINRYVAAKDEVALKQLIHKMKSSFMLIGMKEVWPLIDTIERSHSQDEVFAAVPAFVKICSESVEELQIMQNVI
jgi:HPt (histidine-containing phosphotransfer) domain-containing protein